MAEVDVEPRYGGRVLDLFLDAYRLVERLGRGVVLPELGLRQAPRAKRISLRHRPEGGAEDLERVVVPLDRAGVVALGRERLTEIVIKVALARGDLTAAVYRLRLAEVLPRGRGIALGEEDLTQAHERLRFAGLVVQGVEYTKGFVKLSSRGADVARRQARVRQLTLGVTDARLVVELAVGLERFVVGRERRLGVALPAFRPPQRVQRLRDVRLRVAALREVAGLLGVLDRPVEEQLVFEQGRTAHEHAALSYLVARGLVQREAEVEVLFRRFVIVAVVGYYAHLELAEALAGVVV